MPDFPLKRYAQGDQMHIRVQVGAATAKAEVGEVRILMRTISGSGGQRSRSIRRP